MVNNARLRSNFKNSCFVFNRGFQTLENNKSTRPTASCFHQFSRVWKPRWNTLTRFWNITWNWNLFPTSGKYNLQSRTKLVETLKLDHISLISHKQWWKMLCFFQQKGKKSLDFQHCKGGCQNLLGVPRFFCLDCSIWKCTLVHTVNGEICLNALIQIIKTCIWPLPPKLVISYFYILFLLFLLSGV